MAKSHRFAAQVLEWVFHGVAPAWTQNAHFWISLHTGDPGGPGSAQSDSETTYEGYRRQSLARSSSAVPVDRERREVTNLVQVEFPVCTKDGGGTVTHYGIGTDSGGEGMLVYSGLLDEPMAVQRRQAPRIPVRGLSVREI